QQDALSQTNQIIRSLDQCGQDALRQIDDSMMGPLSIEMSALSSSRRRIDESTKAALKSLDAQAAAARRQIGGAVLLARRRIDAAAAGAAAQLPDIRKTLIQRFTDLYDNNATEITNSANGAKKTLHSEEEKDKVKATLKDHTTGEHVAEVNARLEAERA